MKRKKRRLRIILVTNTLNTTITTKLKGKSDVLYFAVGLKILQFIGYSR